MSDTRLALIPVDAIPDCGGTRLLERNERVKMLRSDAHMAVLKGLSCLGISIVGVVLVNMIPAGVVCALVAASCAFAMACFCHHLADAIADTCGYLAVKSPRCDLLRDVNVDDAMTENALRRSAAAYNYAILTWNACEDEALVGMEACRRRLETSRGKILGGGRFLRKKNAHAALPPFVAEPPDDTAEHMLLAETTGLID